MRKTALTIALILIVAIVSITFLPSCSLVFLNGKNPPVNLMDNVDPKIDPVVTPLTNKEIEAAIADFSVNLFKTSLDESKNTLVSPLSVISALAMTANGADGNTLTQFENLFGADIPSLNSYLASYVKNLPSDEFYKLNLANSIWFTDDERFTVSEDFLQMNAGYYGADIYIAPFDNSTKDNINNWVKDKTDGMIKNIINEIPADAVMYLINALAFDAEWQNIYKKSETGNNIFTTADGMKRDVKFMYGSENTFLTDDNAEGFIKYYRDRKYAFAALLPDEGVSVADYAASLTGEKILHILGSAESKVVKTWIPKFESEYSCEMSEILESMGLTDAFSGATADLSKIGHSTAGNLFISRVLHKTFISVDEKGTKAGAATAVEVSDECAPVEIDKPKEIRLDRPFLYMLIDCETNLPFFIGAVMDIE